MKRGGAGWSSRAALSMPFIGPAVSPMGQAARPLLQQPASGDPLGRPMTGAPGFRRQRAYSSLTPMIPSADLILPMRSSPTVPSTSMML